MNDSTWLYPSAQKILVAMATDAVAPSGKYRGSNSRNHVSPRPSRAVKPGCAPLVFSRTSTHFDGSGGRPTIGPRVNSSTVSERVPMRLVNQLESGTSSIVLMSCARLPDGVYPGVTNRL